jgi:cytochrome bd ubiquinol oxidase subunit II
MKLVPLWFIILTVVWTGFFVLEGFDFGVGMLHGRLGKDEAGRRAVISTIGPFWDGNEVWLIVAAAGTFAAFPGWYATMFSGFYLLFLLILVALIVRGVSFEFMGKVNAPRWRRTWEVGLTVASLLAPLLLGIVLGDLLHGVPINSSQEFTGSFWDLLTPYGIFTGITLVAMCLLHGATFLSLKTTGSLRLAANQLARRLAPFTAVIVVAFLVWTQVVSHQGDLPNFVELLAGIAIFAAWWLLGTANDGWSFTATAAAMGLSVISIFVDLYPNVLVSTTNSTYNLTVNNTEAGSYSLKVMTVIAVIFLPLVLAYTIWNYYVFRRRVTPEDLPAPPPDQPDIPGSGPSLDPAAAPVGGKDPTAAGASSLKSAMTARVVVLPAVFAYTAWTHLFRSRTSPKS